MPSQLQAIEAIVFIIDHLHSNSSMIDANKHAWTEPSCSSLQMEINDYFIHPTLPAMCSCCLHDEVAGMINDPLAVLMSLVWVV